jgi:hypothetical protein
MLSLFYRGSGQASDSLEACGETVLKLVEKVRASYAPEIVGLRTLSDMELAKFMLVDGCFLLELIIYNQLDNHFPSSLFPPGPAAELIKNNDVLSDLMLIENQIPIVILHELSQTLLPEMFPETENEDWRVEFNHLVLNLLGYFPSRLPSHEALHILDLVQFYINMSSGDITSKPSQEEDHVVVDIYGATQTRPQQQLKLKRCALRLLTAGITIKLTTPDPDKDNTGFDPLYCFSLVCNSLCAILFWLCKIFVVKGKHVDHIPEATGLDFYFHFQNRKLEILQLHITKTTKAKWCSLIAWEHHKKVQSIKNQGTSSPGSCNSTCAALIFNNLICSADDVQFLKDKKIVVDHLNMSNQELMIFFRNIALGIDHRVVDSLKCFSLNDFGVWC